MCATPGVSAGLSPGVRYWLICVLAMTMARIPACPIITVEADKVVVITLDAVM